MTWILAIRNRQRARRIDLRRLRALTESLLRDDLGLVDVELGIHLIRARPMAVLNRRWLGHEGSTDIITFDHRTGVAPDPASPGLHGELFISIDDAIAQARDFHTTPALELVRYVVHGVLHLQGHDDLEPAARRKMKRAEDRLLRRVAARVSLRGLVRPPAGPRSAGRGRPAVRRG